MVTVWKIFIFILPLFFPFKTTFANSLNLDGSKSKITYTLSTFGIPFKRKSLPALGYIDRTDNVLKELNLKVDFTSRNPLFRKIIDYDKYPYFLFSSTLNEPIILDECCYFLIDGNVTFHGVTKKVKVKIKCNNHKNKVLLRGYLKIKMTDFGIKPPRILFIPVDNVIRTKIELCSIAMDFQ